MGEYAEMALESAMEFGYDEYDDDEYDNETYWKQKNGELIAIADMEMSHVINTVNMCRRKGLSHLIPTKMLARLKDL